mmetsp:Transcript_24004/g.66705  ORF Transcript_24004/g.66705 Transcript_24004/m.66705 type:complete len:282 (+) Transcript_24004:360-1205(+)
MEEGILIACISLEELGEDRVAVKGMVSRQPQQVLLVLQVLLLEVAVVKAEPLLCPRHPARHPVAGHSISSGNVGRAGVLGGLLLSIAEWHGPRAFLECSADGMRSRQGYDVLVVQPHAVKDVPDVDGSVDSPIAKGGHGVWQVAVLGTLGSGCAAIPHWNLRAPGHLNSSSPSQLDEVRPGDCRVPLVEVLEVVHRLDKTSIGAMLDLFVVDYRPVGPAAAWPFSYPGIVCPGIVPRQADQDRRALQVSDERHQVLLARHQGRPVMLRVYRKRVSRGAGGA